MSSSRSLWLITGAAGALGQALVRAALAAGHDCIALDRDRKGLERLHDAVVAEGLPAPALMPMDLSGAGPDDFDQLADSIAGQFGQLDVLVHNAARFVALRPLAHTPPDEWMSILQAGLTGPWLLTTALLPLLKHSATARIVFIADRHCLEKPANWGAYGAAQAARVWLAQALATEQGPRGPRVVEIDPGAFYSSLRAAAWPVATPQELPTAEHAAAAVFRQIEAGVNHV